jgi:hypothetical protein
MESDGPANLSGAGTPYRLSQWVLATVGETVGAGAGLKKPLPTLE